MYNYYQNKLDVIAEKDFNKIYNDYNKKYAAIDIGSNAMRLLVYQYCRNKGYPTQFNKVPLVHCTHSFGARCVLPLVKLHRKISIE